MQNSDPQGFQPNWARKSTTVTNILKILAIQSNEGSSPIQIGNLEERSTMQNSGRQEFQRYLESISTTVMNSLKRLEMQSVERENPVQIGDL
jgi:hypothetical protein